MLEGLLTEDVRFRPNGEAAAVGGGGCFCFCCHEGAVTLLLLLLTFRIVLFILLLVPTLVGERIMTSSLLLFSLRGEMASKYRERADIIFGYSRIVHAYSSCAASPPPMAISILFVEMDK